MIGFRAATNMNNILFRYHYLSASNRFRNSRANNLAPQCVNACVCVGVYIHIYSRRATRVL